MNEENVADMQQNKKDEKETQGADSRSSENETEEDTDNVHDLNSGEESSETSAPEEEDFKSKFYYLAAEMENMKRRFEREKSGIVKFGLEKVLGNLVPVVDNLERTLDALRGDEDEKVVNIVTGIEMVRTQFLDALKESGLEQVNTLGEIFDPNFHEAMAQQPAEGKEEMEIISVFEQGYKLNGRLLRAAKVVVAKNS